MESTGIVDRMPYRRVESDPDPSSVRKVTFILFRESGTCLALQREETNSRTEKELSTPTGEVLPGEDWLVDTTFRVPMVTAGFQRQRIHSFAVDDLPSGGVHLFVFAVGSPYQGEREHAEVELVELSAEDLADKVESDLRQVVLDAAESFRGQSEESYYADNTRLLEPAYLRATTAEGGSGSGSTPEGWRERRGQIVDGMTKDGTFLDLGCANGHLMDSVHRWAAEKGLRIKPYGVDIGPGLVELARERLPQWADRIEVGNALDWVPADGKRFTYVHMLMDFVLPYRRKDLVDGVIDRLVEPGGRLLVSHYVRVTSGEPVVVEILDELGYRIAGHSHLTAWIDV